MLVVTVRHARLWLESIEDQVPTDVSREVQTSKSDLTARGVAFDLLQMAKRIDPQCKAAEYEDLSGEEGLTLDCIVVDDRRSIEPIGDDTEELSMKAPMSVSKPADLG